MDGKYKKKTDKGIKHVDKQRTQRNGLNKANALLNQRRDSKNHAGTSSSKLQNRKGTDNFARLKEETSAQSSPASPGARKHYLWNTSSPNLSKERVHTLKTSRLHSSSELHSLSNLGQKISNENSLHAVQDQAVAEPVELPEKGKENGQVLENVELKPCRTNSLLEQLLDSKSNRMLQSINPADNLRHSYPPKSGHYGTVSNLGEENGGVDRRGNSARDFEAPRNNAHSHQITKASTLQKRTTVESPRKLTSSHDSITSPESVTSQSKRASRSNFTGKMEILEETDSENEKVTYKRQKSKRKLISKSMVSSEKNSAIDVSEDEKQSTLHAAVANVEDVTIATKEHSKASSSEASSNKESSQQVTSKYLTLVCRNHDGRTSAEKLDAVLFCRICVQAVCYKCAFERHKDHKVIPLASAVGLIRSKMSEQKRFIENSISKMRGRRKLIETSSEDTRKRIETQFKNMIAKLTEKQTEIMTALDKTRQSRMSELYRVQSHQETCWGQIDAVLKTTDDVKMMEEFTSLNPDFIDLSSGSSSQTTSLSSVIINPQVSVDLHQLQKEIEQIRLNSENDFDELSPTATNADTPRKKMKFTFKLDPTTAGTALRISPNCTTVEYIGTARSSSIQIHPGLHGTGVNHSHPYPGGGATRLRRTQFSTVLSDTPITQGKQYWEITVNRSMEYRLGVSYKHMQGTKTLADEHNSWVLCLSYPDRFSAMHKGRKEYIFVASHINNSKSKVMRIGIFLDYEKGILSFYNASNSAEKRHLYTFRTYFNRPVWPLMSLRQGKLQIVTGLPIPRNLVWKTR